MSSCFNRVSLNDVKALKIKFDITCDTFYNALCA